jgi:alpha-galactosidase
VSEVLVRKARQENWPLSGLLEENAGFVIGGPKPSFEAVDVGVNRSVHEDRPKGLRVTTEAEFPGQAVVLRRRLENVGTAPCAPLALIEPLALTLKYDWRQGRHIFAEGGTTEGWYPPLAYRTHEWSGAGQNLRIESHPEGRSSNKNLPLLISLPSCAPDADGLFCGMEWSGLWYIDVRPDVPGGVRVICGVKVNGLVLQPGESLDLPPVHVGFFRGGPDAGTNGLRRHIFEHVTPAYAGAPALPIVSYDHWFGIGNRLNLELMKKQARRAAELHVDTFVVDAAWFPGDFPLGVGNWDRVNEEKFPGGLEALNEHVKGLGMGLGLWFEPERAVEGTSAVTQHPEMFVEAPAWGPEKKFYHINLARRDAQDYLIETIGGWIRRLDLRWSRWDYNIDPRAPWERLDPTGKIQFGYMQGLYRVLDTLMREHPKWMVEQCASGGRRLDLGTMRRGHTCWFSDQTDDPRLCRYMQARANRFIPGNYCNSSVAVGWQQGDKGFNDTSVLSRMLGKLAFDGDVASWSGRLTRRMAAWAAEFKDARHLMVRDFYPLLPQPQTAEDWDAGQFVAYDGADAALFVFAGSGGGKRRIALKGLSADRAYEVSRRPKGKPRKASGADLLAKGISVALGAGEAGLWRIRAA